MKGQRMLTQVTLDAYAVSRRAVADRKDDGELPKGVVAQSSKYCINWIEQNHRTIKRRLNCNQTTVEYEPSHPLRTPEPDPRLPS